MALLVIMAGALVAFVLTIVIAVVRGVRRRDSPPLETGEHHHD